MFKLGLSIEKKKKNFLQKKNKHTVSNIWLKIFEYTKTEKY